MPVSALKSIAPVKSPAEVEIERLGFTCTMDPQFDYSRLSADRRVQVREAEHYEPKSNAAQYAVQMGETQFPPVVVTANDYTVDGSTRRAAKEIRKEKFGPALIVDADYLKNPKTDGLLKALAATLNQTGGQRLTPAEIRSIGTELVILGWKPEAIGRALGIKSNVVTKLRREQAATEKFHKVGYTEAEKLSRPVLAALGFKDVADMNDVPFKQLTELARDANLGPKEVKELAADMRKAGSDKDAFALIAAKRDEMSERIREHELMGNGRPPVSSTLRQRLGIVLKHEADPSVLVEKAPKAQAEHLRVLKTSIAILTIAAKQQEELIDG